MPEALSLGPFTWAVLRPEAGGEHLGSGGLVTSLAEQLWGWTQSLWPQIPDCFQLLSKEGKVCVLLTLMLPFTGPASSHLCLSVTAPSCSVALSRCASMKVPGL